LITNRQKICQRHRHCRVRKLGARPRSRVDVHSVYTQFGPEIFRRAYRMDYRSFKKLARLLHAGICEALGQACLRRPNYRHVPNGPISTSVRLACALRFFAGGSSYDIMSTYQIGHTDFFKSVWSVVKAVNGFAGFPLAYPTSHEKQHEIAAGFQKVSAAGFNCCAGAIDGILIWITKPSGEQCEKVGCSEAKFFCARKHKFGMNCQATKLNIISLLHIFLPSLLVIPLRGPVILHGCAQQTLFQQSNVVHESLGFFSVK
jgi:hypothetical protein